MITVGGIIGAGLFVGSSASIATAGPAAVVSYALAGAAILLVMLIIRRMAAAGAGAGSFTELVRQGLGEGAGFVSGWLYWYFWAAVAPIEALAGANIVAALVPLPVWQISLALLTAMTVVNLASRRSYGECEFWLSSIKVAGVVAFIGVAFAYASGLTAPDGPTWSNLYVHGGFAPAGVMAVLAAVPSAIFSLTGAEIGTLAAAESSDPARAIGRMTRSLALRILLFYVASILLIAAVVPWRAVKPGVSPFAAALEAMHVPGGAAVMNFVVLTAVLSCLNSALYITSRVLRTLASKGDAPGWLARAGARGAPARAVLASSLFGYVALFAAAVSPQGVFSFLVNTSGAVMMFVYILLCLAQLRAHIGGRDRGWPYPLAAWTVIVMIAAALAAMAAIPGLASQFYCSIAAAALVVGAYVVRRLKPAGAGRDTSSRRDRGGGPALPRRLETAVVYAPARE